MTFSVATYNVLASAYVRPEWYRRTPIALLRDEYRVPAVTKHVQRLDADIVCLQEVEDSMFTDLHAALGSRGYFGLLTKKRHGKPDGCATFVRTSSIEWIRAVPLTYDDGLPGQPNSGHVAQIVVLEVADRFLGIANTHLKWDAPNAPRKDQVGYRQITQLLELRGVVAPECSGWIICGDLNTTADAGVVAALTGAGFDFTHRTYSGAATCNANSKARMIDYLFFDGALDATASALPEVADETPLPGAEEPSDHVAVRAVFEWREGGLSTEYVQGAARKTSVPGSSTQWELWHRDKFDRDTPPGMETKGTNILNGLYELWKRTLTEGVDDKGTQTFSYFWLVWGQANATTSADAVSADAGVQPFDNSALVKLQQWTATIGQDALLWRIAELHLRLIQSGVGGSTAARQLLTQIDAMTNPSELRTGVG